MESVFVYCLLYEDLNLGFVLVMFFNEDLLNQASEMKAENGLVCNVNGLNSRWNPLSLDLNGWTSHVNRDDSSWDWLNTGTVDGNTAPGNSDGWEFKETGSRMQAEDEKEKVMLTFIIDRRL